MDLSGASRLTRPDLHRKLLPVPRATQLGVAASQAGVTMNDCIIFYNQNKSGELRLYTLGEHKTTELTKELSESDVYLSWAGRTGMSYV